MKIKAKLKMLFCRHDHCNWYVKSRQFHNLRGEPRYLICENCGKELIEMFIEND